MPLSPCVAMKVACYGLASDRFQTTGLKSCDTFLIVATMVAIRLYFPWRCPVAFNIPDVHPEFPSVNWPCACTHSRLISDSVTEEDHQTSKALR